MADREQVVERDWQTEAGLRAVVVLTGMGHRCGYVAVPARHPLHGRDYNDLQVEVHGGLTYGDPAGKYPTPDDSGAWWFGYDCAHHMDAPEPSWVAAQPANLRHLYERHGVVRSHDYCVAECESLARQLCEQAVFSAAYEVAP